MHAICFSIIVSICVYVHPHYRKVKRLYNVYHHILSLVSPPHCDKLEWERVVRRWT